MIEYYSLSIAPTQTGRSYVLQIAIAARGNGYWMAWLESLPWCAVWGMSREEALRRMQSAVQATFDMLHAHGMLVPLDTAPESVPVIDITEE